MTDTKPTFEVYRCPSCGKPTNEYASHCRHCGAALRPDAQGQSQGGFLKRAFGIDTAVGRLGCYGTVAAILALPAFGITQCVRHSSDEVPGISAQSAEGPVTTAQDEEEAYYQRRVKSGEVCADGPKGLNTSFELSVKQQLKDPDSFEHMGTVITPAKNSDEYDALMRFRSRNSFGGFAVGTAVARLYLAERNLCEVRSFNVEG
ncbi:MAG: hypothetical protein V4537_03290 [Pseudomonadota bacterium]